MTIKDQWKMICPSCKKDSRLYVTALLEVRLQSDGTEDEGGDREWDGQSTCRCGECGWSGKATEAMQAYTQQEGTNNEGEEGEDKCLLCEEEIEEGNGDNWGDLCPECVDRVDAYLDANDLDDSDKAAEVLKEEDEGKFTEHKDYPRSEWQRQSDAGQTTDSYWRWVLKQQEEEDQ
jgi:hypothetical protein